jgi:hypothetical protein
MQGFKVFVNEVSDFLREKTVLEQMTVDDFGQCLTQVQTLFSGCLCGPMRNFGYSAQLL